jgi:xanthosine utilization system XapX-like protein
METWMLALGAVILIAIVYLVVSVKQARDEERRRGRG